MAESPHEKCLEHRGMVWKVSVSLSVISVGTLGILYQIFFQLPSLELRISERLAQQSTQIAVMGNENAAMKEKVLALETRLQDRR